MDLNDNLLKNSGVLWEVTLGADILFPANEAGHVEGSVVFNVPLFGFGENVGPGPPSKWMFPKIVVPPNHPFFLVPLFLETPKWAYKELASQVVGQDVVAIEPSRQAGTADEFTNMTQGGASDRLDGWYFAETSWGLAYAGWTRAYSDVTCIFTWVCRRWIAKKKHIR